MKSKLKLILFSLVLTNLLLSGTVVFAQDKSDKTYVGAESDIKKFLCSPTEPSAEQQKIIALNADGAASRNTAQYDLYNCINRLYRFAIVLASSVGVLFIVIAGYLYMSADGNKEAIDKAKGILASTIASLVILFIGYILLRAINPDLIKFQQIQPNSVVVKDPIPCPNVNGKPVTDGKCVPFPRNDISFEGFGGGNISLVGATGACAGCSDFSSKLTFNSTLRAGQNTFLQPALISKLEVLKSKNSTWRVSEAYPPTVQHSSSCHYNGGCADISLNSAATSASINQLCKDAKAAGLTVVNEYYMFTANQIPDCPTPKKFQTTTGGHLHIQ
jgi:hypothetical protein